MGSYMIYKLEKVKNTQKVKEQPHKEKNLKGDEDFANDFVKELDKQYEFFKSVDLPLKNSVSVLLKQAQKENQFTKDEFLTQPMYENALLESTELGIAYHSAMQCYEVGISNTIFLDKIKNALDEKQLKSVTESKLITAKENLDKLINDKNVKIFKEQKFMMYVPYNKIFTDSEICDEVLVQGIVDLIIEFDDKILLIDYKTNKTTNREKLKETYQMQLNLYKMATQMSFKKQVQTALYAFSVDDFIWVS